MPDARSLGKLAEDRAADYLLEQGFSLVTRRFKGKRGEIDLVALEGDVLVFVEVKERTKPGPRAEESITRAKVQRLASAAREYVEMAGLHGRRQRFDVICFDPEGVRHHRGAF